MYYAIDVETTGLSPHNGDRAFLITLCDENMKTEVYRPGIDGMGILSLVMQNRDNEFIGHNLGFDLAFLENLGLTFGFNVRLHDTLIAAHLHNPLEPSKKLKTLAQKYLKRTNKEEHALEAWFAANGMKASEKREYIKVPEEIITPYAVADVEMTMQLWKLYKGWGVTDTEVYKLECTLIPVVADIVRQGMRVDKVFASKEAERTAARAVELLNMIRDTWHIENPGSDEQVAEFLMREVVTPQGLNVASLPKTEKGALSTSEDALIVYEHPAADAVLEYRTTVKMNSTYLQPMLYSTDKEDRIHASLNQTGARTGRFSSSNPNLQNIPRSGGVVDVRRGFIPRDANTNLLLIDLSQIEYRILAHYCQEPEMVATFQDRAGDLHAATAIAVFGKSDKTYRTIAKTLNFAVIYGAGKAKLRATINKALPDAHFTLEQTNEFKTKYFEKFSTVQPFKWKIENLVRNRAVTHPERLGYVDGLSGRRYWCSADKAYVITNYLCQGEAAMFFKKKMLAVVDVLRGKRTKLINVVHDEFIFDLHKDEEYLIQILLDTIEDRMMFRVPIFANAAVSSTNWAEKKAI